MIWMSTSGKSPCRCCRRRARAMRAIVWNTGSNSGSRCCGAGRRSSRNCAAPVITTMRCTRWPAVSWRTWPVRAEAASTPLRLPGGPVGPAFVPAGAGETLWGRLYAGQRRWGNAWVPVAAPSAGIKPAPQKTAAPAAPVPAGPNGNPVGPALRRPAEVGLPLGAGRGSVGWDKPGPTKKTAAPAAPLPAGAGETLWGRLYAGQRRWGNAWVPVAAPSAGIKPAPQKTAAPAAPVPAGPNGNPVGPALRRPAEVGLPLGAGRGSVGWDKPGPTKKTAAPAAPLPAGSSETLWGRLYAGQRRWGNAWVPVAAPSAGINPAPQKDRRSGSASPCEAQWESCGAGFTPASGGGATPGGRSRHRRPREPRPNKKTAAPAAPLLVRPSGNPVGPALRRPAEVGLPLGFGRSSVGRDEPGPTKKPLRQRLSLRGPMGILWGRLYAGQRRWASAALRVDLQGGRQVVEEFDQIRRAGQAQAFAHGVGLLVGAWQQQRLQHVRGALQQQAGIGQAA